MDDVLQNPAVEYRNTGQIEATSSATRGQSSVLAREIDVENELDLNRPSMVRQLVAEFIGVFALMFVVVSVSYLMGGLQIAQPLAYGMAVAAMVATFATISGGQLNPAVTLDCLLVVGFPWFARG